MQYKISRQEFKILSIITLMSFISFLGIDLHLASMPSLLHYFHTDERHIKQSISFFLLGVGLSILIFGPLSDRYGRKPLVILGLCVAICCCFLCIYADSIQVFLFMRCLQGASIGICIGLGRTMVVDVLHGERLTVIASYFSMVVALAPLIAPALGGYIQHFWGWQGTFFVWGFLLLLVLVLYAWCCPETNLYKNANAFTAKGLLNNYRILLSHPIFIAASLLTSIASSCSMIYATISPFLFQIQLHISPIMCGWLIALTSCGNFLGRIILPYLIRSFGNVKPMLIGICLLLVGGITMSSLLATHFEQIFLIVGIILIVVCGQTLIFFIAATLALSPFHDKRGAASALYGGFQMLSAFIISGCASFMTHGGLTVLSCAYVILGSLGLIIYMALIDPQFKTTTTPSMAKV